MLPESQYLHVDARGFDVRIDDLGVDSLVLAELIVAIEDELGSMLELGENFQFVTLGDLCQALQPMEITS